MEVAAFLKLPETPKGNTNCQNTYEGEKSTKL